MNKINYSNFIWFNSSSSPTQPKQIYAKVIDVDLDNKKALVETIDGSLRIKLNNKTGECLVCGDYVTVQYKTLLTAKSGYISFKNGVLRPL